MRVEPVEISWHSELPIFAKESVLKVVSDQYGWLGGYAESGILRCFLPYSIVQKAFFHMVRFRVETIPLEKDFDIQEEKAFLNGAMEYFRLNGADMVIPATTNAIFKTFPNRADAAPYGSYIIDLGKPEDVLWKNINKISRQNINSASRAGVVIREATVQEIDAAYVLIRGTFKRSKLPFMNWKSFKAFLSGLGEYGKILVADQNGIILSVCTYGFSDHCTYAIYAGNAADQPQGAHKLLQWEAIRRSRSMGIKYFDFVGARINPTPGSKQEALNDFKRRFGATLKQGYIWKYSINPIRYRLYCLAARLYKGGDIVDAERHKLKGFLAAHD